MPNIFAHHSVLHVRFSIALALICVLTWSANAYPEDVSTTVYTNARIYTADRNNPSATAFVVKDGSFIYVGDDEGALLYGKGTDLQGRRVIPGIVDSHCHLAFAAMMNALQVIRLGSGWDLEETLKVLKKKARDSAHKNLPFVTGLGFGPFILPLRATDLDKAIPDRPAMIFSSDIHAYWLNTKAMEKAGLNKYTSDPLPGASYYERDADGNPTGYVVEVPAGVDVMRKLGFFTGEHIRNGLPDMLRTFNQYGITSVYEAGFVGFSESTGLEALRDLEQRDELSVRFFTSGIYGGRKLGRLDESLKTRLDNRTKYTSGLIHPNTLKMFADGTMEVRSAWMHEDLMPPGKGRGTNLLALNDMLSAAKQAATAGFNIHVHAIGDAAITQALDMYEALGKIDGTKAVAHIQISPENGVRRFGEQHDVFFQTTPVWLVASEMMERVLGTDRYLRQPQLASLIKSGVTVTFGSDYPVSDWESGLNPFNNIYQAVNRATDATITPPRTEAISVGEGIDAYTINGARQVAAAGKIGSITEGKSADFVVCRDDILNIDPRKIRDVIVDETYLRGKCVYRR